MASRLKSQFRLYWPAWFILIIGLVASAGLGVRLHEQAVELDRTRLQRIGKVVLDGLNSRVQATELTLRHGEAYFSSQENITAAMFREWCMKYGWSSKAPWLHGLAFYTNVSPSPWRSMLPPNLASWTKKDLKAFEELARATPINLQYAFGYCSDRSKRWPTNYAGQLQFAWRAPRQAEPCKQIQPAIWGNAPHYTTRQAIIHLGDGKLAYGATAAVPIYTADHDALCDVIPIRRQLGRFDRNVFWLNWNLCRGVLLAPIDYVKLESLLWDKGPKEVGVEIFASKTPQSDEWLNAADGHPRALDPTFRPYLAITNQWELFSGRHGAR